MFDIALGALSLRPSGTLAGINSTAHGKAADSCSLLRLEGAIFGVVLATSLLCSPQYLKVFNSPQTPLKTCNSFFQGICPSRSLTPRPAWPRSQLVSGHLQSRQPAPSSTLDSFSIATQDSDSRCRKLVADWDTLVAAATPTVRPSVHRL